MKFAKEFSQDLVPEWRAKYLDYKLGKKKIKAVSRALPRITLSPGSARLINDKKLGPIARSRNWLFGTESPLWNAQDDPEGLDSGAWERQAQGGAGAVAGDNAGLDGEGPQTSEAARRLNIIRSQQVSPKTNMDPERLPLRTPDQGSNSNRSDYGSIRVNSEVQSNAIGPPSLELPDPALSISHGHEQQSQSQVQPENGEPLLRRVSSTAGDAYEVGRTHTPSKAGVSFLPKNRGLFRPNRTHSTPHGLLPRESPVSRMFSFTRHERVNGTDVPLNTYREFDLCQAEFFNFLDKELSKIEDFYLEKESEAEKRLQLLREQLHIMRDRRVQEMLAEQAENSGNRDNASRRKQPVNTSIPHTTTAPKLVREIADRFGYGNQRFGPNSQALSRMVLGGSGERLDFYRKPTMEPWRDFSRRPHRDTVGYRDAKQKLKLALQEFYRGLELLKSYALLNRTAFRKINKKYDKAVNARPPLRYMSEKVNKAWFVQSEKLDTLLVNVEDLYARYFERNNHKVARDKLRSKSQKHSHSGSVFRDGVFLTAGIVFGIEGLTDAGALLYSPLADKVEKTSYLLQLYAGYFLCVWLMLLFVLVCRMWVRSKINYKFIFEFDSRHSIDWRQLGEIPCMFTFFLGFFLWVNFQSWAPEEMFLYWPVVLVGASAVVLLLPVKALHYRSRAWFLDALFRLFLSGLFPVEFRDFFLGDMFCSLTYVMGNIELFFCLYAHDWNNPTRCNSSNSWVLGFLTTIPGLWRALQCLRRYGDTRNWFPHLANAGKYLATCLFYAFLSIYRIHGGPHHKALFIMFATINSVYVSIWDIVMDWSLGNGYATHPFLRPMLGYKRIWMYYAAMVIDPILRFNWLLYASDSIITQHSSIISFFVAFSEVCRRGMWTIFRVENEHCTNVGRFRASRDVPLPYDIGGADETTDEPVVRVRSSDTTGAVDTTSGDPETAATSSDVQISPRLRRRHTDAARVMDTPSSFGRGLSRVGTIIATAHAQDFERKRRPLITSTDGANNRRDGESSDEDDEEDDSTVSEHQREVSEAEDILQRHQSATGRSERRS